MSFIAGAIFGGALIGGVASTIGANKAAGATKDATRMSVEEQRRQYDQTREDFSPWRDQGVWALDQMRDPSSNFYASPDYEFRRSESLRDTGNMWNMMGGGGNAMNDITEKAGMMASSEFGNWYNRMFGQSEAGRGAQGSVAHAGSNASNNISAAYGNQGRDLATIYGNQAANINNAIQSGLSNYLYYKG